jgi:mono/diheme cytochrome c family protein
MSQIFSEVMSRRMQGPMQSPERAVAVEAWLEAQPALPIPTLDAASVARGKNLFDSAQTQCASCHSGSLGTNNQTLDVKTGLKLQVPRLTEMARRGPWFHDGRMVTFADRYSINAGGDAHGKVSQLNDAERADLNAYLKSR